MGVSTKRPSLARNDKARSAPSNALTLPVAWPSLPAFAWAWGGSRIRNDGTDVYRRDRQSVYAAVLDVFHHVHRSRQHLRGRADDPARNADHEHAAGRRALRVRHL